MEENFNIHLISNTSHDVFPNNSPSEFSTLLANEISLNGNDWEVAVRDIMYPTNLVEEKINDEITTYKSKIELRKIELQQQKFPLLLDKYNNIKPTCIDHSADLYKSFPSLYPSKVKPKVQSKPSKVKPKLQSKNILGPQLVKKLNSINHDHTFGFEYRLNRSKFILHVYKEDVLVTLSKNLAKVLGFKNDVHFFKGSSWAHHAWDPQLQKLKRNASKIYLMDILAMKTETFEMNQETDKDLYNQSLYSQSTKYSFDIPYKLYGLDELKNLKDLIPKDYKFTLSFFPVQGFIVLSSKTPLLKQHIQYHNSFTLYSFDKETTRILGLPKYLVFETRFDDDSQLVTNFNARLTKLRYSNSIKQADFDLLKKHKPKMTLYSTQPPKSAIIPDLTTEKTINITLPPKKAMNEMITALNYGGANNGYTFSYSPQTRRISLVVKDTHFVKLSSTLSFKVGFENINEIPITNQSMEANHFPILHKDIHDLYVYTNIVEPVYVGNVKAPLLLSCPLKKDSSSSYLTHLEFQNPTYQKLNRNVFREIEISIRDAFGKLIEFDYGRTVLNLHFRKSQT